MTLQERPRATQEDMQKIIDGLIGTAVDEFLRLERVGALFRCLEDYLSGPPELMDKDTRSAVLHAIDALSEGMEKVRKRLADLEFWQMGALHKISADLDTLRHYPFAPATSPKCE